MALFRAFGSSEQGPVRQTNEDCFALDAQRGLCIVADGMGGHNGGEVASRLAVDGVTDYVRASGANPAWPFGFDATLSASANVLRTAIYAANRKILEAAAGRSDLCGMGTTIVAGLVHGSTLAMAHVGDSRLYIFAAGALRLRTRDDSWALNRNVLTNVLGSRPQVEVHMAEEPITPGRSRDPHNGRRARRDRRWGAQNPGRGRRSSPGHRQSPGPGSPEPRKPRQLHGGRRDLQLHLMSFAVLRRPGKASRRPLPRCCGL